MSTLTVLNVPDMVCGGCASSFKKALATVQGVSEVDVNIVTKTVTVRHEEQLPREEIVKAIDRAGYSAA